MIKKKIQLNEEARQSLKRGIDQAASIIIPTLGPNGNNVILQKSGSVIYTNDGYSIAQEIFLDDEIENIGADMIKQVATETNEEVGDGTTTSVVLAQKIIESGFDQLSNDEKDFFLKNKKRSEKSMQIKRDIDHDYNLIISELDKIKKPINTKEDLKHIATISAESEELGKIISEMFHKLGKNGVITTEDSNGFEVEHEIVDGIELNKGHLSPFMADKPNQDTELENVDVIMTTEKVDNLEKFIPLFEKIAKSGKNEIVLIGNGFSQDIINTFIVNKLKGGFKIYGIEVSSFREDDLKDINALVGGTIIDQFTKDEVELGKAKKVVISNKKTIITGDNQKKKDRIKELEESLRNSDSEFEKDRINNSISRLTSGIGVIKVGANSEAEREYLRLKIEDAINATKAALQDGVVKGGGLALYEMKLDLKVLNKAIKAPYEQIQSNGDIKIGDDVLDPVKVTKTALKKACSLAGIILTAEAVIAEKEEDNGKKYE